MVGRTNALVRALVSSVNGMTGVVTLNANIAFNTEETYQSGTIGAELQNVITNEKIDALFPEEEIIIPDEEDNSNPIDPIIDNQVEEQGE